MVACKGNKAKMLVKKWKVSEVKSKSQLSAEDIEKVKSEAYFEFKMEGKEGKFEYKMGNVTTGTWSLSEDGKTLKMKDSEGKEEEMTVEELTKNKIVLSDKKESANQVTLVPF